MATPTPSSARPAPCLLVIFGASGDLTERKLVPSLYYLWDKGQLPERFAVLGLSRTKMSDEQFRDHLRGPAEQHAQGFEAGKWKRFAECLHYLPADSTKGEAYESIKARMCEVAEAHQVAQNVIYYLSVSPSLYEPIITLLGQHDMVTEGKAWCSLDRANRTWQRIIVEKPFGYDRESAASLNRALGRVFEEEAIYRIDHYLGKETVQNLLVFRFANAIFEPIWNRNYIDHVQITAAESVGVEGRGGYYDSPAGGAMRDMIQSHLLQLMAVVAMEPPVSMRADDIRMEKLKVLSATREPRPEDIARVAVRGQYDRGQIDGRAVPGYRAEEGVRDDSQTDTYAAVQLSVDTWRWGGVPFYLRSGKRMARKLTEIVVYFKPTPHKLFGEAASRRDGLPPNQIVINVQPDEGIRLRFEGKVPGLTSGGPEGMNIRSVVMDFDYVQQFKAEPPEAYATLLLDAMKGDQTLYKHRDEIDEAWRIVQPIVDHWAEHEQDDLPNYGAGTWGPSAADVMLARDGRHWRNPAPGTTGAGAAPGAAPRPAEVAARR